MKEGKIRAPPLEAGLAEFIQGGVSVIVATRNAERVTDVVRGRGCRVSTDRRRITVLIEPDRAGNVLDDIASNGMIAVVFSQPSTHRTIQLKGSDARLVKVTAADRATAMRHLRTWTEDLSSIGYTPEFAGALHGTAPTLAAIAFTPSSAFQQTPGPGAGQPLAH